MPLTVEEKIECLKNLLVDPDDWISARILRLSEQQEEADKPMGLNESNPEARNKGKPRRESRS
jgi:hypothetical protein